MYYSSYNYPVFPVSGASCDIVDRVPLFFVEDSLLFAFARFFRLPSSWSLQATVNTYKISSKSKQSSKMEASVESPDPHNASIRASGYRQYNHFLYFFHRNAFHRNRSRDTRAATYSWVYINSVSMGYVRDSLFSSPRAAGMCLNRPKLVQTSLDPSRYTQICSDTPQHV